MSIISKQRAVLARCLCVIATFVQLACAGVLQPAEAADKTNMNAQVKKAVEQMHGFSMRFRASGRGDGKPDPEATKRDNIVAALRKGGSESVAALAAELASPDLSMRKNASFVLGELAGLYDGPKMDISAVIPELTKAIADKDFEVSVWSMAALGSLGPKARTAIPALKQAMKSKDPGIRNNAQHRLWQIEGREKP